MSEKDSDLVAVMLPRGVVRRYSESDSPVGVQVRAACKRALRPDPPSESVLKLLRKDCTPLRVDKIGRWIEYVLEYGWEPEG